MSVSFYQEGTAEGEPPRAGARGLGSGDAGRLPHGVAAAQVGRTLEVSWASFVSVNRFCRRLSREMDV